jgi:hypothetical protein
LTIRVKPTDKLKKACEKNKVLMMKPQHGTPPGGAPPLVERGGKTTLTTTILHKSKEDRDGHLNSGIEKGVAPAYDRLAEVVAGMA